MLRMLADAQGDAGDLVGPAKQAAIREAQAWIGSRDFFMVCALAGLDGAAVLDRWRAGRVAMLRDVVGENGLRYRAAKARAAKAGAS